MLGWNAVIRSRLSSMRPRALSKTAGDSNVTVSSAPSMHTLPSSSTMCVPWGVQAGSPAYKRYDKLILTKPFKKTYRSAQMRYLMVMYGGSALKGAPLPVFWMLMPVGWVVTGLVPR